MKRGLNAGFLAVALALASTPAHAQVLYGSVVVDVRDQSGAAVPGADVTITQIETNWSRRGVTNELGAASFSTVPPGTFDVQVTMSGFTESQTKGLQVAPNNVTRVTTLLKVGAVTDAVTVKAEVAVLQTDRADVRAEAFNLTNTPHFANPSTNVSNLQLNADGTIRSLGGYSTITGTANSGRDGIDERVFRLGLRVGF